MPKGFEYVNLSEEELARMKADREEENAAKKLETARIEAAKVLAAQEQAEAGKPVVPLVKTKRKAA